MPDINSLASRIDAEFSAVAEKIKKFQVEQVETLKQRDKRLEQLGKVFDQLRDIWKPRLELLVKKFGDRVQATPRIRPRILPRRRTFTPLLRPERSGASQSATGGASPAFSAWPKRSTVVA